MKNYKVVKIVGKKTILKYFRKKDINQKYLSWLKICTIEGLFIGTLTCYINKIHNHANIGLLIGDKKYQGQGFGLDAWNSAINYLFKVKKIRKIFAGTMDCNVSMKKIFIKSGMKFEARFKQQEILNKKYFDAVYYSVFNKIKK